MTYHIEKSKVEFAPYLLEGSIENKAELRRMWDQGEVARCGNNCTQRRSTNAHTLVLRPRDWDAETLYLCPRCYWSREVSG